MTRKTKASTTGKQVSGSEKRRREVRHCNGPVKRRGRIKPVGDGRVERKPGRGGQGNACRRRKKGVDGPPSSLAGRWGAEKKGSSAKKRHFLKRENLGKERDNTSKSGERMGVPAD